MWYLLFIGNYEGNYSYYPCGVFENEEDAHNKGSELKASGQCDYFFVQKQPLFRGKGF